MTDAQKIIDDSAKVLVQNYAPQPCVLDHGEGIYVWDTEGNKYIDCSIGYAVASLGHKPKAILDTINEQASKLMICQASYMSEPKLRAAQLLTDNSVFDRVYFSNSGTESVEAALKLARKWAYEEKGEQACEIIAFRSSFHGRTYGAASVTEKRNSQPFFGPYLPGVHFAEYNNLDSVTPYISDKTAAIIVEPVQGEGGLMPATPKFLQGLRALCDEHNIALIYDEVQAGMGRMGTFFAYESFDAAPDIAALAKGIGGGFPVGAMVSKEKFGNVMGPGTHGTTYGGNPLACAVAATVMSEILKPGFLDNVNTVSKIIMNGLADLKRSSNKITDIRGRGLMIGIDTVFNIKDVLNAMRENGILVTQAGKATARITPPLITTEAQAQEMLDAVEKALESLG
ncbi:MAG: aspartate aminotransferase family protein [Micavibrio sp.]|nr:aspartate aminotransferase family protein [Micavibrio sp.]